MGIFSQLCTVTAYPDTVSAATFPRQSQGDSLPNPPLWKTLLCVLLLSPREDDASVLQGSKYPFLPDELELRASQRPDASNSLLQWAAFVQPMQTHNGCPDIVTRRQNTQSPHISDRDIQNSEKKESHAGTPLQHSTHNCLDFPLLRDKGCVHFSPTLSLHYSTGPQSCQAASEARA